MNFINVERQNMIISKAHNRAHIGIIEIEAQLKRSYFFHSINKLISKLVNTCDQCNAHKYERRPYNIELSPRSITDKPFDRLSQSYG